MNQQYEQQNQADDDDDDDREQYRQPANRDDELNAARKRMAREAEEVDSFVNSIVVFSTFNAVC